MGNFQEKEINLLESYIDMHQPLFNSNHSECGEIFRLVFDYKLPDSDILGDDDDNKLPHFTEEYYKCLNDSIPDSIFSPKYILPWYQQLLWTLVFSIMILVALIGNLIVIWIIVAHRRMRTVTNLFLLNLAIADFLLASGNATFNFVFMLNSHWPFGGTFCVISNFVASLTVSTSVFTILAMSLDRFVAVTRPLRPRMTKTVALSIIFAVWSLSCLLSFPSLLFAKTVTYKYADRGYRTLCLLEWPDDVWGRSFTDHVYNIVFLVVTYVIPMCCMAVTYTWIGCILWGSKVIGENSDPQNHVIKSKQKVVHMLIAVMLLFAICWLPYHIYFLYIYYNREVIHTHFIQHVYLGIYWLAMSNSCYNPIVYYIMNARFRGYFREVVCIFNPSSQTSNSPRFGETGKSLPLVRRTSFVTSHRTRTSRLSHVRSKRNHEDQTPKNEQNHTDEADKN